MDEINQPYKKDQENERPLSEVYLKSKWRLLILMSLSILVSHTPILLGRFKFIEGGVSKNDLMLILILPFLSLLLMIIAVIVISRFMSGSTTFTITWLGENRRSYFFGIIALPITVLTANLILQYVLKRLCIPTGVSMTFSATTPGIALLAAQIFRHSLATPIVEEVFWRGAIQDCLQRMFNKHISLFTQAILFALVHLRGLGDTMQIFSFGLILGIWRCHKKTIVPLIVSHMVINSLVSVRFLYDQLELQKVRITHDYLFSLDKLCRFADYTPEKNALPHYKRAFELLVERPKELDETDVKAWPADLSGEKVNLLCSWMSANQRAIARFEVGSQKPYYFQRYSKESFWDVFRPPLFEARPMMLIILSRAQLSAVEGNFRQSVSDILMCYRFGQHLSGLKPLVTQMSGLTVKRWTMQVANRILQRAKVDEVWLKELQVGLETISGGEGNPIDFTVERLICHEFIQRTFTDDGKGSGRIPRLFIGHMKNPPLYLRSLGIPLGDEEQAMAWRKLRRKQTTQITNKVFAFLESIKDYTPKELQHTGREIQDTIQKVAHGNVFVLTLTENYAKIHQKSYRCKAKQDALIVTVAIMRYKLAHGETPDELDQLVQTGYLNCLPLDPYSDAPFVYKKVDSDFLLYSFGPDFDDDGGIISTDNRDLTEGDDMFWSPEGK